MFNLAQTKRKSQSLLNGALVLAVSTMVVKVIGILYKVPLSNMIGAVGRGYFDSAYTLYIPVYTIAMAGLPVAVSKMVAQQIALNRYRDARMVFRVATRLFLITGTLGTIVLLLLAYPYALIAKTPPALPAIIAIAPSIFFCCVMSIYRGYYNGLQNMTPTAVSQVIEAVGKVIFGLACSKAVITYGLSRFDAGLTVFGETVANKPEALRAIYPYAAAGAAVGVTAGTVAGMIYMMILHKVRGDGFTRTELVNSPRPMESITIAKSLIAIAVPVVASTLVFSVTNLIDAITIQARLGTMIENNLEFIKDLYSAELTASQTLDSDIKSFLYGAYAMSLDFKNLIPSLTMSLGVSAIPALSAAWAVKDKQKLRVSVESVLRVTLMISFPAGIGMAVLAKPIMELLYGGGESAPAISIATPIMAVYGYTIFLIAISQPMTSMLQALGKAGTPVKSLALGAVAKVIANYIFIGIPKLNIFGAIFGTLICYFIIAVYNLVVLVRTTKIKISVSSVLLKPLFSAVLSGVAAFTSYGIVEAVLPALSVSGRDVRSLVAIAVAVVMAVLIYAIAMLLVGGVAKDDILMLPKGKNIAKLLAKYGLIG